MAEGFMTDVGYGSVDVAKWQGGKPQKSFWTGIKKGDPQFEISTMRCNRCGFLESYAKG
jgi:hypothetical protein